MKRECRNCKYSCQYGSRLECHREPPRFILEQFRPSDPEKYLEPDTIRLWPEVQPGDWCGEFSAVNADMVVLSRGVC